jgi:hypothetical protein
MRRIEPVLRQPRTIVFHGREAGDSLDFDVRHGRALHARAVRECLEMLLTRLRSRRRRPSGHRAWETAWPATSRTIALADRRISP